MDTRHIEVVDGATGHAVIMLDPDGENTIVIHPGANHAIPAARLGLALAEASPGDILLLQNETCLQAEAAQMGRDLGMRVVYAAAPFDADAVVAVLPLIEMLILNAVEAEQLASAMGQRPETLSVPHVLVTRGADGCSWYQNDAGSVKHFPALAVQAVDTTGAGDTFAGYLLAGLDRGQPMEQAIILATKAAALMVTRLGTAEVIPDLLEIQQMDQPPTKGA